MCHSDYVRVHMYISLIYIMRVGESSFPAKNREDKKIIYLLQYDLIKKLLENTKQKTKLIR